MLSVLTQLLPRYCEVFLVSTDCTCAGGEVWDIAEFERVGVCEDVGQTAEPGAADDADRRPMVRSTEQELCR